ncbi:hypothetical protein ACVWWO_000723 [Bradyrhizobium sp. F1.13.1]
MESDRDILAVQRKLAHCRQLAKDFPDGPTAKHIRELEDELRAELVAELRTAPPPPVDQPPVGTRPALQRWRLMPKETAIALWSLAAACVVAFSVAALVSPH